MTLSRYSSVNETHKFFSFIASASILLLNSPAYSTPEIAVLMFDDMRQPAVTGFFDGLEDLKITDISYSIYNAQGNRDSLPGLAETIVASSPFMAVAAGGIEADALKSSTENNPVPVLFLAVSSSVSRGLVESLAAPGGNLTGIDTWDSELTPKRLELITYVLPEAGRVLALNIPSIPASAASMVMAEGIAPELGLELTVVNAETTGDIQQFAANIDSYMADVFLILPAAPIWNNCREVIFPACLENGIPIFGVNADDLGRGACFAYAGSRYDAGYQAARLARKILSGTNPGAIPVETPRSPIFGLNNITITLYDSLHVDSIAWDIAETVLVNSPLQGGER